MQRSPFIRVSVYHCCAVAFEVTQKESLCLEVALHGAVIIEMIAGEIGEHHYVEFEPIDPPLVETVGRHFHGDGSDAPISECAQNALQLDGTRGRQSTAAGENLAVASNQNAERSDGCA